MNNLKEEIKKFSASVGLDLCGVTTAEPFESFIKALEARDDDYKNGRYAYRLESWKKLATPRDVLPDARAVIVIGFCYLPEEQKPEELRGQMGRIVAYGHLGILKRARLVRGFLEAKGYKAVAGLHRKEAAVRAGLGFLGKNNLVINPDYGSWVAYQSIVTNAPLAPDEPFKEDLCGNCDKCLKACPTGALYEPRRLNPERCVACLLTTRDVPENLLPAMKTYILGCDICQEVCPRNLKVLPKPDMEGLLPEELGMYPPLDLMLRMNEEKFQKEVIGFIQNKIARRSLFNSLMKIYPLRRILMRLMQIFAKGKEMLPETFVHASGNLEVYKRNALVAVGNSRATELKALVQSFEQDDYLGDYARWSLRRLENE